MPLPLKVLSFIVMITLLGSATYLTCDNFFSDGDFDQIVGNMQEMLRIKKRLARGKKVEASHVEIYLKRLSKVFNNKYGEAKLSSVMKKLKQIHHEIHHFDERITEIEQIKLSYKKHKSMSMKSDFQLKFSKINSY